MEEFCREIGEIYRLKVPFDTVYTSVFLVKAGIGAVLVDCATTAEDVEQYILPALEKMGIAPESLAALVLTHSHDDHAGGLKRMLESAPHLRVVREACTLGGALSAYSMPGHTPDCIGLMDARTDTLISGDGLQGAGVDKYRCSVQDQNAYRTTIDRIARDEGVQNLLFSHAYEPWYEAHRFGRENVLECLRDCLNYIE